MKRSAHRGGSDAAPFFDPLLRREVAGKSSSPKTPQRGELECEPEATGPVTVPGIVNGERAHLACKHERPLEKEVEIRIRVALATAGVLVMKHHVDNRGQKPCRKCGHKDPERGARTGLGLGVSDLICVVPPSGRFLGIEVKRPGYVPSEVRPEQTRWLNVVQRFGGVTGIAASVEEAMALVDEARKS